MFHFYKRNKGDNNSSNNQKNDYLQTSRLKKCLVSYTIAILVNVTTRKSTKHL
jgi:hypothetical protein